MDQTKQNGIQIKSMHIHGFSRLPFYSTAKQLLQNNDDRLTTKPIIFLTKFKHFDK